MKLSSFLLGLAVAPVALGQSSPISTEALAQLRSQYLQLSRQIYATHDDIDSQKMPYVPEQIPQIQSRMHHLIIEAVQQVLSSSHPTAQNIRNAINGVQGAEALSAFDTGMGNTPYVQFLGTDSNRSLAVAYGILLGGDIIPKTRPYLELYRQASGDWSLKATVDAEMNDATFFIKEMNPGIPGEDWFLTWGTTVGDTGARLRLFLYAFDGRQVRTIWSREGLSEGLVQVHPDSIILDYNRAYNDYSTHVHEMLHIIPNGLK